MSKTKRMVGYLRLVNKATTHLDIHVRSQMTRGSELLEKYQILFCILKHFRQWYNTQW